jgi:hypothetical protein
VGSARFPEAQVRTRCADGVSGVSSVEKQKCIVVVQRRWRWSSLGRRSTDGRTERHLRRCGTNEAMFISVASILLAPVHHLLDHLGIPRVGEHPSKVHDLINTDVLVLWADEHLDLIP